MNSEKENTKDAGGARLSSRDRLMYRLTTPRRMLAYIAASATLLLTVGLTYALFSDSFIRPGMAISNGALQVTTEGVTWQQTTPGVDPAQSGDETTLKEFLGSTGDVLEVEYAIETRVRMRHSSASLSVNESEHTLPAGITPRGWKLLDSSGALISPTTGLYSFEDKVNITTLNNAEYANWRVVVVLDYDGDARYTDSFDTGEEHASHESGIRLELTQNRDGA